MTMTRQQFRLKVAALAKSRVGKAKYSLYADGSKNAQGVEVFDCSSFTKKVYAEASQNAVTLPHNAYEQSASLWHPRAHGDHIRISDLVFFYQPVTHVGIVTDIIDGEYWIVQASSPELGVVHTKMEAFAPIVSVGRAHQYLLKLAP